MTVSLRVVMALLAISILALLVTGEPMYSRFTYLWGLLLVVSWIWAALALRGVKVQRMTRARRAQVGEVFQEQFEIQNDGRLPRLWLEVRDRSALPNARGSRVFAMIKGQQRRPYSVRTRLVRRGAFPLGPTVLAAGDPFGLFPVSRTLLPEDSLLVYPITVDVRDFPGPPGLLPGGEALRRRTHQVTPNASGVRKYSPGDSLNRIHWPSTARRDTLMAKEFELDPLAEVWIFVDSDRRVQAELPFAADDGEPGTLWQEWAVELPPSTEEYAVSIAASLGQYFLRRRRAVGLVSWGRSLNVLSPDRGGRQLNKILEALALLGAEGRMPISALVTAESGHMPRGSTVVLVTPSVEEEVALAVDILLRRGLRPVVVLLDASSFGGLPGTEPLATAISTLQVPVCVIENGADLSVALSMAAY
jgi:uncharacterized protein (DUF58 family)